MIHSSHDTVWKHFNVQGLNCHNNFDAQGENPTGGGVYDAQHAEPKLTIEWQDGPRGTDADGQLMPSNGAFVEDVIYAALQRLQFFQDSKYKTRENAIAITKLEEALMVLNLRRLDRANRSVEGKHEV